METRVAYYSARFAGLFSLTSFFWLLGNLRYVPLQLTIIAGLLGVAVGAVSGFAVARRRLNSLTKNGETRVRLPTILFLIGGFLILLSLWYFFVFNSGNIVTIATVNNFTFPALAALWASDALMSYRWERKYRKLIYRSGRSGRLYTSPKSD